MANDKGIGITLPLQRGQTGYFAQSFDVITQLKSNLINLILTKKGERVFQPDFGSDLHELIFEQMDADEWDVAVANAIQRSISKWMPFLQITEIDVTRDDNRNRTTAKVTFTLTTNESVNETIIVEF